jgi:two-component system LytT family sensor kinase
MNVRPENPDKRHDGVAIHDVVESAADSRNIALRRVTIIVVTIFWIGQFGANTLFVRLTSPEDAVVTLLPRALTCVAGEIVTLAGIALQHRWRGSPLSIRAYLAIAFTIASAAVLGALAYPIFNGFLGPLGTSPFWVRYWSDYPVEVVPRLWTFASVYAMALAISYAIDVRAREEEISALRTLAQDAQLRALRSQLSPHFLFNALNSIAALIREGRPEQAEETTEHLADFLRTTLSLDPQRLITVGEETSLQRLYLNIQQVRFPTRLNVIFNIAPDVEGALVPSLILQPLVENSIKYAVARSTSPVTVNIRAKADGEKLQIIVEDDGGNASSSSLATGNRMGLANVAERLSAHYADDASLDFGAQREGGFRNTIIVPLRGAS